MALITRSILSRVIFQSSIGKQCRPEALNIVKKFSTSFSIKNFRKQPLIYLAAGIPITVGAGYYLYKLQQQQAEIPSAEFFESSTIPHTVLPSKPNAPIARSIKGCRDDLNLNLTLFQYPTCPFCCKVRAFLDYYGLPYDVVEVDPVLRQQTKWTTYKKVPILLAKVEDGYQQLNDSTMIISALKTYLMKADRDLKDIVELYPMVEMKDEKGKKRADILNKYFLMYEERLPKDKTTEIIKEEKKWREWADNTLVHMLSPNVYRTYDEAMQAFNWFSEVGEWDRLFPSWERNIIIHAGAIAMWMISKRLKKRHNILEDERESLYQVCRKWMRAVREKKSTFMGGDSPNLADLAVYGVLSSIEGCNAFQDMLENTTIGNWYYPMKQAVTNHEGKSEIFPRMT